ncbi:MAG: AMP-binding protein [Betaproteobacteria bacterium]|nr:AMP-binding protein [Betaproteobacteria bacterium]
MPVPETEAGAAGALLHTVSRLAAELHPHRAVSAPVTLDSALERDLGFDSLGRVELLLRLERAFGVSLPEQALVSSETPRDLLRAVLAAVAAPGLAAPPEMKHLAPERAEAAPVQAATLAEVLEWHAAAHPTRVHLVVEGTRGEEQEIGYGTLRERARAVAASLQARGLGPGQTVAIMLPTGPDYFYSFLGVLLAGAIPVPIYPPVRLGQMEEHLARHAAILANALATMLIAVPEAKPLAAGLRSRVGGLREIVTPAELAGPEAAPARPAIGASDIALLQYTSGSTGSPKGVVLTHANLLANIRAMGQAAQVTPGDVFVSWLPLYHDMGLICAWLTSLHYACRFVVMSPLAFLARPARWLRAIHRHRGTISGAPNFAYELCLRKIEDAQLAGLDLGSWRIAFNGAEPVSPETITGFQERFGKYGLRPEAVAPVYGLAECCVGLAYTPGRGPVIDRIRRAEFVTSGRALPAAAEESDALRFVGCGRPLPGHEIRVVDGTGHEVGERQEGRLEFRGPSATSGYFRNPEATRRLFRGDWLDSGDYAYTVAGEIYVTGRAKDVIIRAGRNVYPQELEEAVGNIPGIRQGSVAVFGCPDPAAGTERLVVLAETREAAPAALERLRGAIGNATVDLLGAPPDDIVLTAAHAVLKTSSGKVRRAATRELYLRGFRGRWALWLEAARLAWREAAGRLRRSSAAASGLLYAAYAWTLFWLLATPTWTMASLLPRPAWSWAVSRIGARLLARATRTPFFVEGLEHLPQAAPCVLVANHASYLDGIVLVAALPRRGFSFVAKRELRERPVSRVYLEHLGAEFVERFEAREGAADTARLAQALRGGRSLIFFAEGTFGRVPGLAAFRMGAFVAAAQAGVPALPVTIRGTRPVLRAGHWFPRHGAISVIVGRPILPQGTDWTAAVGLRDAVRAEILRRCGEPDLAGPSGG